MSSTGPRAHEDSTSSSSKASNVSAGRAIVVSVIVLGVFLCLLMLFLSWKMRHYLLCTCCLPDDAQALEADNLLSVAQAVHSRSQGRALGSRNVTEHAVKKGFDHLPSYIAAKLAGSKKAKRHKHGKRGSASRSSGSPRGSESPRGIQLTSRSKRLPEDRHAARDKDHNKWEDNSSLDNSMRRSDDSTEALIGVEPDQLDPELMQSDPQGSGGDHGDSRASSVSLTLTEQYSVASCSYPPLSLAEIEDLADDLLLKAGPSGGELESIVVDE